MVVRVIVSPLRETVCTYVPARARLISSLSSSKVPLRWPASFLIKRGHFLTLGSFLCWAGFVVAGWAVVCEGLAWVVLFFLLLFRATVAPLGAGAGCKGFRGRVS